MLRCKCLGVWLRVSSCPPGESRTLSSTQNGSSDISRRSHARSDIDLCITSPSLLHRPPGIIFTTLARALTSHSIVPSSRSIEQVLGAKVPILKFQTSPSLGSFCVDVSLNSSNGPQGAEVCERLLRALGEGRRERAERLLLVWKTFLRSRDLGEVRDGGMGGMSAFMMVVHWFQVRRFPFSPARLAH